MREWVAPVGVVVVSWGIIGAAAGCGQPSASDLWSQPMHSGARSAHATVAAVGSGGAVTFQGDGTVVFKPRPALSIRLRARLGPGELDVLQVDGVTYQRSAADQKWTRSPAPPPDPTGERATDPHLLGQDTVSGDRAWHLRASRGGLPVDMWVRTSDGYPLEVVTNNGAGTVFTFVYDRFNGADSVAAPPALDMKPPPRVLSGRVGDMLTLNAARIAVLSSDDNAVSDDDLLQPRPGNHFVVVEVSVQNTGASELSTFLDWQLTDSSGSTWREALAVREPQFQRGELEPGETSRGFLTYEVSSSAFRLVLSVKLDGDIASFALT